MGQFKILIILFLVIIICRDTMNCALIHILTWFLLWARCTMPLYFFVYFLGYNHFYMIFLNLFFCWLCCFFPVLSQNTGQFFLSISIILSFKNDLCFFFIISLHKINLKFTNPYFYILPQSLPIFLLFLTRKYQVYRCWEREKEI